MQQQVINWKKKVAAKAKKDTPNTDVSWYSPILDLGLYLLTIYLTVELYKFIYGG